MVFHITSQFQNQSNNHTNSQHQLDEYIAALTETTARINLLLMVFGIFVNIVCIFVFFQRQMRKRKFNLYLLILAIFELIFCSIVFVDYCFRLAYSKPIFLHDYNLLANIIIDYLIHSTDTYVVVKTNFASLSFKIF
jgi:hypothetical protein